MGSPESERGRGSDEGPQHEVTIGQDYYLGKYEVTQAQWKAVMGSIPAMGHGAGDDYPVYYVSWNDMAGSAAFSRRSTPSSARRSSACRPRRSGSTRRGRDDDPVLVRGRPELHAGAHAATVRCSTCTCGARSRRDTAPGRSGRRRRTPGASSTCTATSGSGCRTATARATWVRPPTAARGKPRGASTERSGATTGTAQRTPALGEPRVRARRLPQGRQRGPPRDDRRSGSPDQAPPPPSRPVNSWREAQREYLPGIAFSPLSSGCTQRAHATVPRREKETWDLLLPGTALEGFTAGRTRSGRPAERCEDPLRRPRRSPTTPATPGSGPRWRRRGAVRRPPPARLLELLGKDYLDLEAGLLSPSAVSTTISVRATSVSSARVSASRTRTRRRLRRPSFSSTLPRSSSTPRCSKARSSRRASGWLGTTFAYALGGVSSALAAVACGFDRGDAGGVSNLVLSRRDEGDRNL